MDASSGRDGKPRYLYTVVLFILVGGLIGASAYVAFFPATTRIFLKVAMVVVSLLGWIAANHFERYQQYRRLMMSFFAVSLGVLMSHYFGGVPVKILGFSLSTVQGVAMAKFGEALPIVLSILVLHFATGGDADRLFLKSGNVKMWLVAGVIGVAIFICIAILQAIGSDLKWATVAAALPWILIFIFSNAFMEELWFRALFLKKLEPLVGMKTTIIITSIVFAGIHISSTYVIDILQFMVVTLVLGLLWAWLMRKSNSIWAPVVIHAAADVLVMVGFLAGANL